MKLMSCPQRADSLALRYLVVILLTVLFSLAVLSPEPADAYSTRERVAFQRSIRDYRHKLNPRFKKIRRKKTSHIIVHTSEGNLRTTLEIVSRGKRISRRYRTYGGHANYVISRSGRTYRILDKQYRADHAGRSMWNGVSDISSVSVGIELVGYHYTPITDKQYHAVGVLIEILQRVYDIDDRDVLTHSQVAYGRPNRWFRHDHRGRKRCAKNFIRAKAGLGPTWSYDPDVRAGRLTADPKLAKVFYTGKPTLAAVPEDELSNVISRSNTAWSIAGEDYNSATTVYKLPNGRTITGDRIEDAIGWQRVPPNTVVLLNQQDPGALAAAAGPVKTIRNGLSAWSFAGIEYNRNSTIYFLPNGGIKTGSMISDWDELPEETHVLVGYRGPYSLGNGNTAYRITRRKHDAPSTVYYFPTRKLLAGNEIKDFSDLPRGTLIFLPVQ